MIQINEKKENIYEEIEGEFFCKCLNKKLEIVYDKKLSLEFIDEAVQLFYNIYPKLLNDLCKYTIHYCKDTMENYPDIAYKEGLYHLNNNLDILKYIEICDLKVGIYNGDITLNLSGGCDWSDERGLQWILQDTKIVYVGPWDDLEIWTPGLKNLMFNYCTR